jgi:peptidoglycan/xylan/chitin deacetylase (PgdA/CDA1 family)
MKNFKILTSIVLLLSNMLLFSIRATAETFPKTDSIVISHLAEAMDSDGHVLAVFEPGTQFKVIGSSDNEVEIQWGYNSAYISKDFVVEQGNLESVVPNNEPTSVEIQFNAPSEIFDVNSTKVATIEKNNIYPVYSLTDDSYQIVIGNQFFWVRKSSSVKEVNVNIGTTKLSQNKSNQNSKTTDNLISKKTQDSINLLGENIQSNSNDPLVFKETDIFFNAVEDDIPIYSSPDQNTKPIGTLVKGQEYLRNGEIGDWHIIKFGKGIGYVLKQDTIPSDGQMIHNRNQHGNSSLVMSIVSKVTVFDNSSGDLVPFASLEKGVSYPVIRQMGNWYEIDVAGRNGFIYKTGVERLSFDNSDRYFTVTSDQTGIYENSKGNLVLVGKLTKGQEYPRVSDYGNWHQVKFGSRTGYVWAGDTKPSAGKSIKNFNSTQNSNQNVITNQEVIVYDNTSGDLVPYAVIEKEISYPIIGQMGNWYKIDVLGRSGFVYKDSVRKTFSAGDKFFQVITEKLGVYQNQNGELVQIGTLEKGQKFTRVSDYGNWHEIRFLDKKAFVWKASTTPSDTIKTDTRSNYTRSALVTGNAIVYDNGSGMLVPFATINKDSHIPILSVDGNWYEINLAGRKGYIYKDVLTPEFSVWDKYFEVNQDHVSLYIQSPSGLKEAGVLEKGQVFERVSDYGNWHQIKFGNSLAYVYKGSTVPTNKKISNNVNLSSKNILITSSDAVVYDNSGKDLVAFGKIKEAQSYPYISKSGNWYKVILAGRVGYVYKDVVKDITYNKGIPVLLYHHLLKNSENRDKGNAMILAVETFEGQMKYLHDNGYYTATLPELEQYIKGKLDLPAKTVVITFDDGFKSNYVYAYPILKKYNQKAGIFVITGRTSSFVNSFNPNEFQYLSLPELIKMRDVFVEGSHTSLLHYVNTNINQAALLYEDTETIVKDLLVSKGMLNTNYFAYPFGAYNSRTLNILRDLNFNMAFTISPKNAKIGDSLLEIGRYTITPSTSMNNFKSIVGSN